MKLISVKEKFFSSIINRENYLKSKLWTLEELLLRSKTFRRPRWRSIAKKPWKSRLFSYRRMSSIPVDRTTLNLNWTIVFGLSFLFFTTARLVSRQAHATVAFLLFIFFRHIKRGWKKCRFMVKYKTSLNCIGEANEK